MGIAVEGLSEMSDEPKESGGFLRGLIGLIALGGAMVGFFALFYIEIPARNENALLLALGVVLGWAGAVVASEYGATTTGRKVAESAIRKIERSDIASGEVQSVEVVNAEDNPANVKETKS